MINKLKNPAGSGQAAPPTGRNGYHCCLLLVAGQGGLLFGVEVGIIAGQLSFIVATVLLGSVIARWFAGRWAGKFKRTDYHYWAGANQPDGQQFWN